VSHPTPTPKLVLAPLKGFTDALFRRTFSEHFPGFDAALAPFVTACPAERLKERQLADLAPGSQAGMPVVPQILGNVAEDFVFVARRLHAMGYTEVNWNLGCPFRPVAKKRRGSGLLPFPELVGEFLEKTIPALPGGLSIKMRLGRNKADEIFRLLPVLERYPIREIIIHPRTGIQMYTGHPDLDSFERCLGMTRHRVVYNGDITDPAGFAALRRRFPQVECWMIGRGALADPFLPAAIKAGGNGEGAKVEAFKAFYADLFGRYQSHLCGPGHLLGRMKGFWKYFAGAFTDARDIERRVHRCHHLPQYVDIVERFLGEEAEWMHKS
jgi:tRNA-dihydrouridine synthase